MHLALTLFTILAAYRWGDWPNWKKYHTTMLYIAAGGLLYEYVTQGFTMWKFHADLLRHHQFVVILYAIVTMPLSTLIFLSRYPEQGSRWRKLRYYLVWVAIYITAEYLLDLAGYISYENEWTIWYSLLFDLMMFPMLRLHHVKPLAAYLLSVCITVFLVNFFHIPFREP